VATTFLLMLFSWVLFRAEDLTAAGAYCGALFGLWPAAPTAVLLAAELYGPGSLLVLALCAAAVFQPVQAHDWSLQALTWTRAALLLWLFVLSLLAMFSQAFNPFLYFQF
jgi:alginate O-acetyltransferase complex protein AlgI